MRETNLLATQQNDVLLSKIEEPKQNRERWAWGANILPAYSYNRFEQTNWVYSDNTSSENFIGTLQDVNSGQPAEFVRISRPFMGQFSISYNLSKRIFISVSPTISLWKGEPYLQSLVTSNKTTFFGLGGELNIGYKYLIKRRWSADIVVGTGMDNVLTNEKTTIEGPVNLIGSSVQLGVNYYLTERIALRLSPNFNWFYANASDVLANQFQDQKGIGINCGFFKAF
jgi:hypothetical protein